MNQRIECWNYFNCEKEYRDSCPVYLSRLDDSLFYEGWFIFDHNRGGPANRGPCVHCDIFKKQFPDVYQICKNKTK